MCCLEVPHIERMQLWSVGENLLCAASAKGPGLRVGRVFKLLAASYTHRFARSTFQRFSYATFRLRKFSVAVWRGSEGIGVFLLCHVETPGNQWTGAQFGGASLAHARTRKQWKHAHLFKGFSRKIVDRWTFSKARVGVFYRAP